MRGTSLNKQHTSSREAEPSAITTLFHQLRFIPKGMDLNFFYNITPLNRTYSLKADLHGLTDEGRNNIIGFEGTVWTEYITENQQLEKLVFPRLIAVSKLALGENNKPYKEFVRDVHDIKKQLNGIAFSDEKSWTKPRISMVYGWLEFVKNRYTADYIKEQLFK